MKLESIKSLTLTILVGISLLLTFGLWSYQPNNDIYSGGQNLRSSIEIGGKEETKQSLIEPSSIIFHIDDQHYGFADPHNQHTLFKSVESWTLYDFQLSQGRGKITDNKQVEIVFPEAIPMQIASSLLTFDQVDSLVLPDWSFDRIIITFNKTKSILKVHFISEDGRQRAMATVNNSSKYNILWDYITEKKDLNKLVLFDKGVQPIYIPDQSATMVKRQLTVYLIEPTKLVNVLFKDPNRVSWSNGDYSDGVRGMSVLNDGRKIEYYNPILSNNDQLTVKDLIEQSIKNINDHKGWTDDDYRLVQIDPQTNEIEYRMYYEGYPTFSDTDLTIIEQQWRNTDLFRYNRPLMKLKSVLNGNEEVLPSGSDIIDELNNYAASKNSGRVQDIQIGYQYSYQSDTSNVITLDPAWFVKINDQWKNIEELIPKKGGARDAMESN